MFTLLNAQARRGQRAAMMCIALLGCARLNADTWTPTATANAPAPRSGHTAVWTGTEMIVWGGIADGIALNSGGRYNPATDAWTPISTVNAPAARFEHTAVWTGSEMIVWGGSGPGHLASGGRYNPVTDTWAPTSTLNAPTARSRHSAVWTGVQMIVWGGGTGSNCVNTPAGARYDVGTDSWAPTSVANAPDGRCGHGAVWAGDEMIVMAGWYGSIAYRPSVVGRYRPSTDTWVLSPDFSDFNAGRGSGVSLVWSGTTLIAWGGVQWTGVLNIYSSKGLRFIPPQTATRTSDTNVPQERETHGAVWTGTEMIVWGGRTKGVARFSAKTLDTGGRYNPASDSWVTTTMVGAPTGRAGHTALWTGTQMIVWGGYVNVDGVSGTTYLNSGGRYDPRPDLSIADAQIVEGQAGTSLLAFPITLSHPVNRLGVEYALAAGTSTSGVDYTPPSGTLVIQSGQTTATLLVRVLSDAVSESDETLTVTLNSSTSARLVRSQALGTIVNGDPPASSAQVIQYRLYHEGTKEHLYTADLNEYNVLGTRGWTHEGIAYGLLTNGLKGGVPTVPLFRLYHPGTLQHLWTTDANEAAVLSVERDWSYEGTAGYLLPAQGPGSVPLYRMALAIPALHLWTTDKNEYDTLAGWGWVKEGVIGYVMP